MFEVTHKYPLTQKQRSRIERNSKQPISKNNNRKKHFGRPKGDHRTWAKNGTGTKKTHPLWHTFGSKMAPQGTKMLLKRRTFSS